jgi:hypothetical protein
VLQSNIILRASLRDFSLGVCLKEPSIDVPRVSRTCGKTTGYDYWRLELLGSKVRIEDISPLAPIRNHLKSICGALLLLLRYCVLQARGSRAIYLIVPCRPSSLAETLSGWWSRSLVIVDMLRSNLFPCLSDGTPLMTLRVSRGHPHLLYHGI